MIIRQRVKPMPSREELPTIPAFFRQK
ncbi:hypothetical protein ACNZ96_004365 [Escherichia coli]